MRTQMTEKAQREVEESFDNTREAHVLLDLIVAEFESDPLSVSCFDLRVVERAVACVKKRKALCATNPYI